jgi:protein TonB
MLYVDGAEQAKRLVSQTPPASPSPNATGTVQLTVLIGKDGHVHNIGIQKSGGMELDVAAMQAVKKWVYSPVLINGEPRAVVTTVIVKFGN